MDSELRLRLDVLNESVANAAIEWRLLPAGCSLPVRADTRRRLEQRVDELLELQARIRGEVRP